METPVPPPHPDGPWVRLGEMLARRRTEIEPRYKNRTLFAEATGLNWRLLHDVERAKRDEFKPETLAALENAYQLAPGAIGRALQGGVLEPAAGPRPAYAPVSGPPDLPVPEGDREAAKPIADEMQELLLAAVARTGNPDPPGDEIFPAGSQSARSWDRLRRDLPATRRRLWMIALLAAPDSSPAVRRHGTAAGLTAPEAALDCGSSAGGAA